MSGNFYILSIDGGGFRGAYAAHILKRMEEEWGINWHDQFDMFAGTSTGAIIAAGLACKIPARRIEQLYRDHGHRIFRKRWFSRTGLLGSRYSNRYLSKVLKGILGDRRLGEIDVPLILTATDIGNGCVHVFKSSYDTEFVRDKDVLVREAVLASCSAPTYFDPYTVGEYLLADGGLWANSPSLVAAIDAKRRLGADLNDLKVLSVGTGVSRRFYSQSSPWWRIGGWGFATGWGGSKFVDMLMNLQAETANNMLGLILNPEQILRLNFDSPSQLAMDDPHEFENLVTRADKDFTHAAARIRDFLGGACQSKTMEGRGETC